MGTVVQLKNQINNSYFQLRESVDEKLVLVDEKIKSKLISDVELVQKMTDYHILTGGKRLRALLTLGSAKLCSYTKGGRDINLAACVELIHSATLMHDDVIDTGDLRKAIDKSDFDDKVFGRGGIIDGWYKKSERDFPKFLKRNSNLKWKNYNASSLTYGIGKPLYKIVDSLLDGINSLVPESKYPFSEFYERFKK